MTVLEVIQRSTEFLSRKGVDSPRLQVELLLAAVLQVPRLKLYLDFERQLTGPELDAVRQLVKRRATREPLQHLVGSVSFCGLELRISRDVLIPRPETEVLAERAWQFLREVQAARSTPPTALDFGTGSGCLALALARHVPNARLCALDISEPALALARSNAERLQVAEQVEFVLSPGFEGLPPGRTFDLIVTNPPYISTAEIEQLAPEVRDHDPRLALDGGPDGLSVYRLLASQALPWLAADGRLLGEFGDGQGPALQSLFQSHGWRIDDIVPDLSGRARILVASRSES